MRELWNRFYAWFKSSGSTPPTQDGNRFTTFDFISIVVNLVFFAFSLFVFVIGEMTSSVGFQIFGTALLVIQTWHIMKSVKIVQFGQQAILLVLGRIIKKVRPNENSYGIVYDPYGLALLLRAPTGIIEKDIPADPRMIWHGDATKTDGRIPPGYFPPNRVTFASKPDKEVTIPSKNGERKIPDDDAYLQRNTAEVEMAYGWQIHDLGKLIQKFGYKNTVSKAQSQMDDTAVGTFTAIFSKVTAAEAMTLLIETAEEIKTNLGKESEDWGISVAFARMKPFNFSHELNDAVSGVAEALQRKRSKITDSEGEKIRLRNIGIGNGDAEYEVLSGRAEGEMELAEVAATPGGQYAMAIQAVQRGLETAKAVIVPQDNVFGIVAGIQKVMEQTSSNVVPFPPPPPSSPTQGGTSQQRPPNTPERSGRRRQRSEK